MSLCSAQQWRYVCDIVERLALVHHRNGVDVDGELGGGMLVARFVFYLNIGLMTNIDYCEYRVNKIRKLTEKETSELAFIAYLCSFTYNITT
jgi:hypothetical protein